MSLEEWIAECEAEHPERALWPCETDARRFRDIWCTGHERLESNGWDPDDEAAYWWLVKADGNSISVDERTEIVRASIAGETSRR